MARRLIQILLILIALGLLLYYPLRNFMISLNQKDLLATFESGSATLDRDFLEEQLALAKAYNQAVFENSHDSVLSRYEEIMNFSNGLMARIRIPVIGLDLGIYHGESAEVLLEGAGHHQNSAFPIGGINTRALISGHSGLASAKLFTRLDELQEDDLIFIDHPLESLAYSVIDIEVIEPDDLEAIKPIAGKDLISLITCTPYGINTHRLLITAERIEFEQDLSEIMDAIAQRFPLSWHELAWMILPAGALLITGIVLIRSFIKRQRRRRYLNFEKIKENL